MARLMSVALTERAVMAMQKHETRRLGWSYARVGDELELCRKVMGRRRGEPLVRLCRVRLVEVRSEPLNAITDAGVDREGFGPWEGSDGLDWWPVGSIPPDNVHGEASRRFVAFFTEAMRCTPDTIVTVLRWEYLTDPRTGQAVSAR